MSWKLQRAHKLKASVNKDHAGIWISVFSICIMPHGQPLKSVAVARSCQDSGPGILKTYANKNVKCEKR